MDNTGPSGVWVPGPATSPAVAAAEQAILAAARERARLLKAPNAGLKSDDWLAAFWDAHDRLGEAIEALAAALDGEQS